MRARLAHGRFFVAAFEPCMTSPAPRPSSALLICALATCATGLAAMGAVMVHMGKEVIKERSENFSHVRIVSFEDQVRAPGMVERGKTLFTEHNCVTCHGYRLEGIVGPCLTDPTWIHGGTPGEIKKTLDAGVVAKGMPSFAMLKDEDKAALIAFIYSRKVTPILLPLAKGQDSMKRDMIPDADVPKTRLVTPAEALADFRVPADCVVDCLASEPMVVMPVAASFDARGRLWVVEIRSFMRNVDGTGEHDKNGCLAVLEDTDGDGVFDKRTDLFTDLVSPRAVLPYDDGILFADDTRLLWAPVDTDLKPGNIEVVDDHYAKGGSVEHKPNGLCPHLDGWIYNAKSGARYRRIPGTAKWEKSGTAFRGQWGISSDDFGRLVANTNSNLGFVDVFPPNTLAGVRKSNPTRDVAGTAVAPRRVTPGINRAYLGGSQGLNAEGKLINCTSACAPWFARGAALGQWQGLFICEPTSYLLKYVRMKEDDKGQPQGTQPITDTEFLTSTDELFRPVFLADSPDGSLLVVDMHVGIVQHSKFVSGYLRRYILKFGLDKFTGFGRLYRVRSVREPLNPRRPALDSADAATLVKCLSDDSGWWRDMARRQIVERQVKDAAPLLRDLLKTTDRDEVRVQAMWALANLGDLKGTDLTALMTGGTGTGLRLSVCQAALTLPAAEAPALSDMLRAFAPANPVEAAGAIRLAASLGNSDWRALDWLLKNWAGKPYVNDAAFAGLGKNAKAYAARPEAPQAFAALIDSAHPHDQPLPPPVFTAAEQASFKAGKIQFELCAGCHGADGGGLDNQGPMLDGSQWVKGDKDRLLTLLLCGLTGPVTVAGEKIEVPMEMPGLGQNKDFSDKAIADVATYIRNAWGNRASAVAPADVAKMRKQLKDRITTPMTEPELLKHYGDK